MTPAEVIAMRDNLARAMVKAFGNVSFRMNDDDQELADWLIESGWVVAPPNNEGENNE